MNFITTLQKVILLCGFFFAFFKLYKWYQFAHSITYYLIGENLVRQKRKNFGKVTKIMSDEKFCPTKLFVGLRSWPKSVFSEHHETITRAEKACTKIVL